MMKGASRVDAGEAQGAQQAMDRGHRANPDKVRRTDQLGGANVDPNAKHANRRERQTKGQL